MKNDLRTKAKSFGESIANNAALIMLLALGCAMLYVAIKRQWWTMLSYQVPSYFVIYKLSAIISAVLVVGSFFLRRYRSAFLITAGTISVTMPLVLILVAGTIDARTIGTSMAAYRALDRLANQLTHTDVNFRTPWEESRIFNSTIVYTNDYTLIEGFETIGFFVKAGWYASFVAGIVLIFSAWIWNAGDAKRASLRVMPVLAISSIALVVVCLTPIAIGSYYYNKARAADGAANYPVALAMFREADHWDKRFDYDIAYHVDLGTLYGRMNATWMPDYWGSLAMTYMSTGFFQTAYQTLHERMSYPQTDPGLAEMYSNVLMTEGTAAFQQLQPASAMDKIGRASRLEPNNMEMEYGYAQALTKTHNYEQAVPVWEDIILRTKYISLYRLSSFQNRIYVKPITDRAMGKLAWCYYNLHDNGDAMDRFVNSLDQGSAGNALTAEDE